RFAHPLFLHSAEIHVVDGGIRDFLGLIELGELEQTRLGNLGDADMGGLAALGINMRPGQNPEERGFSDLRQSNNSGLHKPGIVAWERQLVTGDCWLEEPDGASRPSAQGTRAHARQECRGGELSVAAGLSWSSRSVGPAAAPRS